MYDAGGGRRLGSIVINKKKYRKIEKFKSKKLTINCG
jgi:hypothetical protein